MAARIPTRVKAIVERVEPLANWLKSNKPDCKTIHIFHKDWLFLVGSPLNNIRPAGFNITKEGGLSFGRFSLKPVTPQKVEKQKESI